MTSRPSWRCRARGRGNETRRVKQRARPRGSRSWPQAPRLGVVALRWLSGLGLKSGPQGQLNYPQYSLSGPVPTNWPLPRGDGQRALRRRAYHIAGLPRPGIIGACRADAADDPALSMADGSAAVHATDRRPGDRRRHHVAPTRSHTLKAGRRSRPSTPASRWSGPPTSSYSRGAPDSQRRPGVSSHGLSAHEVHPSTPHAPQPRNLSLHILGRPPPRSPASAARVIACARSRP
jgi:hypothetical protein